VGLFASRASATPFTGTFGPTIFNDLLDVNGDNVVDGTDVSRGFFGDTDIIAGGIDCDAWNNPNEGAAGDGIIDGADDCTLIGFDGTADGAIITVSNGSIAAIDGVNPADGRPMPHVYPDVNDNNGDGADPPTNGDIGDSAFAWSAINGRVDANGNEAIDSQDCSNDLADTADVLSNDHVAACGIVPASPTPDVNGLIDLDGDRAITAADTCTDNCIFGRDVVQGELQIEGGNAQPAPIVTPSPSPSPTAAPSAAPSASPSASPSAGPTAGPTASPTAGPTASPTAGPTVGPTATPTIPPSGNVVSIVLASKSKKRCTFTISSTPSSAGVTVDIEKNGKLKADNLTPGTPFVKRRGRNGNDKLFSLVRPVNATVSPSQGSALCPARGR
jgi:hypothetical protein